MLLPGSLLSRSLALVLLGLGMHGGARLVVAPLLAAFLDNANSIEQAETLLQRYLELAEQRPAMAERLAAQQEFAASAAGYLQGPSDALAAAQLQDRVRSVVEGAGGQLRSTQILPAKQIDGDSGIRRAALRVQIAITIDGLAQTLYELESGQPYLLIDQLSVREERTQRRRRDEPDAEASLYIGLELSGYLHGGGLHPRAETRN
jgi:general secretion pathway protein M